MEVKPRGRSVLGLLVFALIVWAGGYFAFRAVQSEVWAVDGRTYVIYPDTALGRTAYYAWRPLAWLDDRYAGVGAHIGPHRPVVPRD